MTSPPPARNNTRASPPVSNTRFLFSSVPLQGHFWPCLCVAAALAKRGHDVTFAAYEEKRAHVSSASPLIAFRALAPLTAAQSAHLEAALARASDKAGVPPERRAPRVGSTVFPFYEEHAYRPLLAVAKGMVAEEDAARRRDEASGEAPPRHRRQVVVVCEHACLAAHDVAETLALPLALLWQLPLQYALSMAGQSRCALVRDGRVPVELPGAVLPERMQIFPQRVLLNPYLKRRQLRVLWEEYVPKRLAARERAGVAAEAEAAAAAAGERQKPPSLWSGDAPFAPAEGALPRRAVHIVSGSMLLEPEAARRHALPPGWSLSGPQGVDLSTLLGETGALHHPAVSAVLAEEAAGRVVYVAFGTLATFGDRDRAAIEAMARAFVALATAAAPEGGGTRVIWSLPPAGQALLPPDLLLLEEEEGEQGAATTKYKPTNANQRSKIVHVVPSSDAPAPLLSPPRVLVVPRAEQQALLSHPAVKLFVSHAGLNSLCEALVRGVPLVCWPLFADQFINASHARNAGVGVVVPDDGEDGDGSNRASPGGTRRDARAIEAIVRAALADGGMAARAKELGERLRAEPGGAETAAKTLEAEFA